MSFFGFDTSLPPDDRERRRDGGHNRAAPGFAQPQDAFAGLSSRDLSAADEALDFEDTYDGLGDQLEESGDAFNDDTFGAGPATQETVGRDFDFFGQTDRVADAIREEQLRYQAVRHPRPTSPPKKTTKPARTGYEGYIPQLEASSSIWGLPAKKSPELTGHQRQQSHGAPKKMMTLEEIEASLRAQAKKPQPAPEPVEPAQQAVHQQFPPDLSDYPQGYPQASQQSPQQSVSQQPAVFTQPPQILQRPQHHAPQHESDVPSKQAQQPVHAELPAHRMQHPPQILQRQHPRPPQPGQGGQGHPRSHAVGVLPQMEQPATAPPVQPRQILQNPNRISGQGVHVAQQPQRQPPTGPGHRRGPSYQGPIITSPQQILQLSDEDRAAFLMEEAKRAKRNHKIAVMAKGNGFMTPQDKNFVSRLQLTQLMAATGNVDDQSAEAKLNDDFYYQVYTQIRGGTRQNPHQPANQFAQTYLFQTGNRYGGGRRYHRGGDNSMQRMELQVQRAVEVARQKQKPKDLNFAGSLGKIAFSNSKTPRPLLNIKAPDGHPAHPVRRPSRQHDPAAERRETLRNIENIYLSLMAMEDHERQRAPLLGDNPDTVAVQRHMEWRETLLKLNKRLWNDLKIMEPVNPGSPTQHPFIAILSMSKGKKLIPRVWRHLEENQKLTILTLIAVHLDSLDVVAQAVPPPENPDAPLSTAVKDEVELFATTVIPTFFTFLSETDLRNIEGLLGLILDRSVIPNLVRTKAGVGFLTLLISRVMILKESAQLTPADLQDYARYFNRLFDLAEPALPYLFTPGSAGSASIHDADDMHIWQFLAAMGANSSPEQQQRLVIGVKDRVMETINVSRALPAELKERRLGNVNLFMRAIGLDVELLVRGV